MINAYIGLGSNLENPETQIRNAIAEIDRIPDTRLVRQSSLYQTHPVGPQDQPDYINAVVHVMTGLSATDLLHELQKLEDQHGRTRKVHWGARTLDLDLLLYNDNVINEKHLVVPHPEMHNRAFVLCPLYEIAPDVRIAGTGSIKELLNNIDTDGIHKLEE